MIVVESENSIGAGIYLSDGARRRGSASTAKRCCPSFARSSESRPSDAAKLLVAVNAEEVGKLAASKAPAEANGDADLIWLSGNEARTPRARAGRGARAVVALDRHHDTHGVLALLGDAEAHGAMIRSKRPSSPVAPLTGGP